MKDLTLFHLLHKEFSESRKTHKVLITSITFVFFGMLSPLTAFYMPELIKILGAQQGMIIEAKTPFPQDSLIQFHSNIIQACLFVMIFLMMGSISQEKERGTAAFLMVKPISRDIFILSKYISMMGLVLIGLTTAVVMCAAYTRILFGSVPMEDLMRMSLYLFTYLLIILSISLLLGTIFSSQISVGVGTFFCWLSLEGLSAIPKIGNFLPGAISKQAQAAAMGLNTDPSPLAGATGLILICFVLSLITFRRWEA